MKTIRQQMDAESSDTMLDELEAKQQRRAALIRPIRPISPRSPDEAADDLEDFLNRGLTAQQAANAVIKRLNV